MSTSLFTPISPENIQQAIDEINRDGVRSGRQSSTYDVLVDSKRYPPKYLLSLAHKYATGQELDHNQFEGGELIVEAPKAENKPIEFAWPDKTKQVLQASALLPN